jgi:hypothetical protein
MHSDWLIRKYALDLAFATLSRVCIIKLLKSLHPYSYSETIMKEDEAEE